MDKISDPTAKAYLLFWNGDTISDKEAKVHLLFWDVDKISDQAVSFILGCGKIP